jgi:hypothetical protein
MVGRVLFGLYFVVRFEAGTANSAMGEKKLVGFWRA